MNTTRHLRISGRVQGVGYRDALRRQALALGLAGWVRNRRDGTVEAVLQGDARSVEEVIAWPPAARVDRIDAQHAQHAQGESDRPYVGFEMLPTA
jgi:acylphosphatase